MGDTLPKNSLKEPLVYDIQSDSAIVLSILQIELIEDPVAEERVRRERQRQLWTANEEKNLCTA